MAIKFLKGTDLNAALEHLIADAENELYLICPYFHLHEKLKDELKYKKDRQKLRIVILFGKNEEGIHKSLHKDDFNFLKTFPNIEIWYEPKLHAKYYANESQSIITSLNLLQYSHNNNIEVGVIMNFNDDSVEYSNALDKATVESREYFEKVIKTAELKYRNVPVFEKAMLGLRNQYISSKVEVDVLSVVYESAVPTPVGLKTGSNQYINKPDDNKLADSQPSESVGYCIRTGQQISFNLKKPYCPSAFNSWSKFSNKDYPEKFCHFSGESSDGATSFASPILKKNWKKAKEQYKL